MALSTTTNRITYAGNSSTTAFSFPYYFLAQGDLVVIVRNTSTAVETTKTLTTHYTVAGAGVSAGGTVTMLSAPATGETLILYRDPALTQGLDLVENDSAPAESSEQAYDRAMMVSQRVKEQVARAVRLTDGFSPTFDTTLPSNLNEAASKVPLINASGSGFADCDDWPSADDIEDAEGNAAAALASQVAAAASQAAAATSATAAATSATAAQTAVNSVIWRDVVFKTFSDSPITIADADRGKLLAISTAGGNVVVNLPTIAGLTLTTAWAIGLKKTTSDTNTITVNRGGSDTINGNTTATLDTSGGGIVLIPDTDPAPDTWTSEAFGAVDDGSITNAKLAALVYSDLSAVTPQGVDSLPLSDASDSGNKKKVLVSLVKNAVYRSVTTTDAVGADDETMKLSGASFTSTLPTAVGATGKRYKFIHAGTNFSQIYTLATTSAQTIGSYASGTPKLSTNGEVWVLESDGANWIIISHITDNQWTSITGGMAPYYTFTITSGSATLAATYTNSGHTYTVAKTIASQVTLITQGTADPAASGTLTKASGTGDATLTFSAFTGSPLTIHATTTDPTWYGSPTVNTLRWRRRSNIMEYWVIFAAASAGVAGSGDYLYDLPGSGALTIDTTNTSVVAYTASVGGTLEQTNLGIGSLLPAWGSIFAAQLGRVQGLSVYNTIQFRVIFGVAGATLSSTNHGSAAGTIPASSANYSINMVAHIPITEWQP